MDLGAVAEVDGADAPTFLDPALDLGQAGSGFAAEDADAERRGGGIPAHLLGGFEEMQAIGRRGADDGRSQVVREIDVTFGLAAANGENRRAQALGAAQQPPTADKEIHGKRQLNDVARAHAGAPHDHRRRFGAGFPVLA